MMNFGKWFGIIVFVAIIDFLIAGCTMDPKEDAPGETGNSAIALSEDSYTDGALTSAVKEQWFKFTATASTQYIHVVHGTLSDFSVELYDNNKNPVGSGFNYHRSELSDGYTGWYSTITVTRGKVYYLKVTPYSGSGTGTYRIACNTMVLSPGSLSTAKTLAANTWVTGSIPSADDEGNLYKFTATTATTHYLHIKLGTLTQVYVRLYDSNGSILENRTSLTNSGSISYQFLTSGSAYYVSLWSTSNNTGTYQIAVNTSSTAP